MGFRLRVTADHNLVLNGVWVWPAGLDVFVLEVTMVRRSASAGQTSRRQQARDRARLQRTGKPVAWFRDGYRRL